MTDREYLELAAKAADYDLSDHDWRISGFCQGYYDEFFCWNPLTDDGDALRLAVKLRLVIDPVARPQDDSEPSAAVWCQPARRYITEPFRDDPYAATRRAIVRAAAEIGKAL